MEFRLAAIDDARALLEWRNDALTREMSHHSVPISRRDHTQWLEKSLKSKKRMIFIVSHEGHDVGTIRVDTEDDSAVLTWILDPGFRGLGIGNRMLGEFIKKHPGRYRAEVKLKNQPSLQVCLKNGFIQYREEGGVAYFKNF